MFKAIKIAYYKSRMERARERMNAKPTLSACIEFARFNNRWYRAKYPDSIMATF
jgi:hypothetical protein